MTECIFIVEETVKSAQCTDTSDANRDVERKPESDNNIVEEVTELPEDHSENDLSTAK